MDDLIKRQDAIDAIYKESKCANSEVSDEYADMFVYALKTLPSAQKTGEWMTPKDYCQYLYETTGERCSPMATGLESFVYCSQCGEPSWFSKNYCPHCGARMEC